jgi:hypothetical protein
MSEASVCPKCGCPDVIPDAQLVEERSGGRNRPLQAEVDENPGTLLFRGAHLGALRARVCGRCGFTELFVSNPEELLAAYRSRPGVGREPPKGVGVAPTG